MWLPRVLRELCERCRIRRRRSGTNHTAFQCTDPHCSLWSFHRAGLGMNVPEGHGPGAMDVKALRREHAEATARFRGSLPAPSPAHDWDADARFHGLFPTAADTGASAPGQGGPFSLTRG